MMWWFEVMAQWQLTPFSGLCNAAVRYGGGNLFTVLIVCRWKCLRENLKKLSDLIAGRYSSFCLFPAFLPETISFSWNKLSATTFQPNWKDYFFTTYVRECGGNSFVFHFSTFPQLHTDIILKKHLFIIIILPVFYFDIFFLLKLNKKLFNIIILII